MAQTTQPTLARNTRDIRARQGEGRVRNRNWCFTLNNYTKEEVKKLTETGNQYLFQEETGENKTPHLQGCMFLPNAVGLKHMKTINPRAHWEICKNKPATLQYCSKEDTRTGQIYTNIDLTNLKIKNGTTQHKKISNYSDIPEDIKKKMKEEFIQYMMEENFELPKTF